MLPEENRVLVVAPVGQDAEAIAAMLRAEGLTAEVCIGAGECQAALEHGAGALLLTEEALELPRAANLLEYFDRQPAWSEVPLIVLTSGGESRSERLLEIGQVVGGMTLLERPMSARTLLHSVHVALRSRQRQYQVRDLLAERERFRALVTATSDVVYRMSADWTLLLQMRGKGFLPDTDTASSEWMASYIHPDDHPRVSAASKEAIRTRRAFELEHRVLRADGTVGWTFSRAIPLLDRDGAITEWFGTAGDITERKRAEEALRESEHLLWAFLEQLPVGAALMSLHGEIRLSNGAYRRLVPRRIPSRDPERQKLWRSWDAQGRPVDPANWPAARALRGERVVPGMEFLFTEADGREVWQRVTAVPFRDAAGELVGAISIVEDIDAMKRAQEALRQANERLSYHVNNTPLAVVEFDAEFRVRAWSEGAQRVFGWEAPEVLGRPMWELPWICDEDRGKVEQVAAGLMSGQMTRGVSPNRNVRKDGQVIWCEWYNSSLTDVSGKMQSIQSLVLDVTKRKEAEAVLAGDKEQLEKLVAERTAALRELVGELEHFSYSITHDMRAPLRAMMGFAEAARELCAGSPQSEQELFLDRIQTAAKRMDLLITDALNYSKAVRSELPLAPVDVGRLLRGMVDTYPELQGAQDGIRIEPNLPLVMGNEAGLTQCFSNLLGNAVKFVKSGHTPEIRVWAEPVFGAERRAGDDSGPGEWVRIWVEDRGAGIGARMLPRVFDMFARGGSDRAGTGIGLALVRKVVDRMGGRVGVESEEGKGSRFWVLLKSGDIRRISGREI